MSQEQNTKYLVKIKLKRICLLPKYCNLSDHNTELSTIKFKVPQKCNVSN